MTEEDKQLLLVDLCARLPYFTKIYINGEVQMLDSWADDDGNYFNFLSDGPESNYGEGFTLDDIKPYLRPMSSMTSDEWIEWCDMCIDDEKEWVIVGGGSKFVPTTNRTDWLNSHHFDYRGLIEKGLALEAPENMYNIK